MNFKEAFTKVEQQFFLLKGEKNSWEKEYQTLTSRIQTLKKEKQEWLDCNEILKEAALITQKQFAKELETISQIILDAVFGKRLYSLKVELEFKYSKTNAKIYIMKEGIRCLPLQTSGGVAELVAFSLILALFRVKAKQGENVLFLDEPFKSLKGKEYPQKAASILFNLAHKMGMQIIIISHSQTQIQFADTVYRVEQYQNKSNVLLQREHHVKN